MVTSRTIRGGIIRRIPEIGIGAILGQGSYGVATGMKVVHIDPNSIEDIHMRYVALRLEAIAIRKKSLT